MLKSEIFTNDELVDINTVKTRIEEYFRTVKFPPGLIAIVKNGILTGGASASLFHNETPNDWDIYLTKQTDIDAFIDLTKKSDEILKDVEDICFMNLTSEDVVRNRLVGEIVDAYGRWDTDNGNRNLKRI